MRDHRSGDRRGAGEVCESATARTGPCRPYLQALGVQCPEKASVVLSAGGTGGFCGLAFL